MKHIHTFENFLNESSKIKEVVLSNEILNFLEERGVIAPDKSQKVHKDLTAFLKGKLNESINEEFLNEALKDTREIVGKEMEDIVDALNFLGKSPAGVSELNKACNGKVPYTIFLNDEKGFPKPGGLHSSSVDFTSNTSSNIKVEDYIDIVNSILDDHGYDKLKVKILK